MTERLRLTGITKSFGGLSVAADINLSLSAGDRTALIGPNGAGKTTLVNLHQWRLAAFGRRHPSRWFARQPP